MILEITTSSYSYTPVFFNLFAVAEPLQAVKSLAEPHAVTLWLCELNLINNFILAYTAC